MLKFSGFLLLVLGVGAVVNAASQVPLVSLNGIAGLESNPSTQVPSAADYRLNDLNLLSSEEFSVLNHPAFPHYSVRIKKSDFCDGNVGTYTGYIDISEVRHLFFYFFESRNDPDTDDVVFWTNGGPGASSAMGLFMELGPCRVAGPNSTTYNPYGWNDKANVFFIDQPVGVGFSYADYGEKVETTPEAAKDIAAFVAIFFEHFSKFKGRGFHMAGESYGGRYVPLFASAVYDQNAKLIEAGLTPINLSSIMIGNGCTDFSYLMESYYDMQCTPVSVPPIQDISTCVRMKQAVRFGLNPLANAIELLLWDSYRYHDALFCDSELDAPFAMSGYNPYDISKRCEGELLDTFCYPLNKDISAYLSQRTVREILGVDNSLPLNFSSFNVDVNRAFLGNWDHMFPTQLYIAALLERGIRVLIYAGSYDVACNWVSNERMLLNMEWLGQEEFRSQPLREWTVDGVHAGRTRSAGLLTFATIDGAGHMAPYDKPVESLVLANKWLAGDEL
ncbi:uncharacterized protein FIBRA_08022 [Fibroporia radiculosa]|uniref:Carboxypeptidase n=1 Tax=Fibroporia radiculosa TaxID=599839 RepID=J4H4Y3_9APHY|nr:uncharacterized protein FIBRA_08022 [Fibroporia radiculosa]CCM05789.1 predicted protein [Fibroporia radiculosa]